ncbi:MAG: tRNA (N6-threonylcarbamoyladenosine(37)-N6)-methyltransferase TrmO [Deltaproteobacteria bacterium]|nr:tRNA (N6-threonylcarbamoyladenosine(37)-N6)-methyltransferase TrmO [Deltaproteobacteria bacterium]
MVEAYQIYPIGVIRKQGHTGRIEIKEQYREALMGLENFSHIVVCYWFEKNDTTEGRGVLQVHPRGDRKNPLTGVFATHSPKRPNLIAISLCQVVAIEGTTVIIDEIDAFDQSPVIDIKCYIPSRKRDGDVRVPDWVKAVER